MPKKEEKIPLYKIQDTTTALEYKNLQRIEYYVSLGNIIYDDFLYELAKIAARLPFGLNSKQVFSFDQFPGITDQINKLIKDTTLKVSNTITGGMEDAFLRANAKNDVLVDAVFKGTGISKRRLARYYNRNLEAAVTRKTKSQLSKRVYNITKQFKQISEAAIDQGIASGKTASNLAREIKAAVKDPRPRFNKVKTAKGNTAWSKAAKKYIKENPPGQGVYLNPQKNYERLTRTEINMSYRTADHNRNEEMDFIVGIKVNLSNNPNHCPLCIELAGLYPKSFLFRGWHPQCRCYRTTVLKTREEMDRDNLLIIQGKEPSRKSVNTVKKPNKGFTDWVNENKERINGMRERGTEPYFLTDNVSKDFKIIKGEVRGGVEVQ